MVRRILLSGLLIIPALLLMGFTFPWDKPEKTPVKNIVPVKSEVKMQDGITVYYFYAKPRCVSCQKIEKFTQEAVNALNNSKVIYKAVNLDEVNNKHYFKDYGLYTKSVVLSKINAGKEIQSKNLDKIWTKLGNEGEFKQYITKEINKIME
ncbi:MAG TPA: nitrophenyl compound nitroreductase subunit ArsF family protein [Candidatus Gastranaerophilales bacterium]|nr:nitrophenyl compound nitroreductase subunit ArsF family protein [Candidatus Gastranaerophilales bacterium]